jgi:hypothetical protein
MQRKEPVANTRFLATQFHDLWSRQAPIRVGRQSTSPDGRGSPKLTVNGLGYLATSVGGLNRAISAQHPSLNHFVGTYEQRPRDRESKRRCNLAVDQEFELGRLLHG